MPMVYPRKFGAAPKKIQEILKSRVDEIIEQKRLNTVFDASVLERDIDNIVYHLYGLTYDEVLIIDPQTPITLYQYKSFNLKRELTD